MNTRDLKQLEREYNPENDLIPNTPSVTYTDSVLLNAIFDLIEEVETLKEKIDALETDPHLLTKEQLEIKERQRRGYSGW